MRYKNCNQGKFTTFNHIPIYLGYIKNNLFIVTKFNVFHNVHKACSKDSKLPAPKTQSLSVIINHQYCWYFQVILLPYSHVCLWWHECSLTKPFVCASCPTARTCWGLVRIRLRNSWTFDCGCVGVKFLVDRDAMTESPPFSNITYSRENSLYTQESSGNSGGRPGPG